MASSHEVRPGIRNLRQRRAPQGSQWVSDDGLRCLTRAGPATRRPSTSPARARRAKSCHRHESRLRRPSTSPARAQRAWHGFLLSARRRSCGKGAQRAAESIMALVEHRSASLSEAAFEMEWEASCEGVPSFTSGFPAQSCPFCSWAHARMLSVAADPMSFWQAWISWATCRTSC